MQSSFSIVSKAMYSFDIVENILLLFRRIPNIGVVLFLLNDELLIFNIFFDE